MANLMDHLISTYIVPLPDEYESIGTVCGVKKLDTTQAIPSTYQRVESIKHLTKTKICRRVTVVLPGNAEKTVYMVPENFDKIKSLVGLSYQNLTIKKAYFSGTF